MRTPASLLADLLAADPARPRVTFYDDAEGPTCGERIELSGRVAQRRPDGTVVITITAHAAGQTVLGRATATVALA